MEKFISGLLQLSLLLMGIVPLIYVLTVSLLGRAIKRRKEEEESQISKRDKELKIELEAENKTYQKILETKQHAQIKEAKENLDKIIKKNEASKEEIKKIGKTYGKLSLQGSIVPFFWFTLSFITVLLAQGLLLNQFVTTKAIGIIYGLFTIACIFIIIGLIKQYQIMQVVQEVAYPAEEALMQMTVDAFKQAIAENEESKRPVLKLNFDETTPPFQIAKNTNFTIKFNIELLQGDPAHHTQVCFHAPQGFDFPNNKSKWTQTKNFDIPNALTTNKPFNEPICQGLQYTSELEITTPDKPGKYTLLYSLTSEKFKSDKIPFIVNVT